MYLNRRVFVMSSIVDLDKMISVFTLNIGTPNNTLYRMYIDLSR